MQRWKERNKKVNERKKEKKKEVKKEREWREEDCDEKGRKKGKKIEIVIIALSKMMGLFVCLICISLLNIFKKSNLRLSFVISSFSSFYFIRQWMSSFIRSFIVIKKFSSFEEFKTPTGFALPLSLSLSLSLYIYIYIYIIRQFHIPRQQCLLNWKWC